MLSQFGRGEAQSQGISRATPSPKALGEGHSSPLPVSGGAGSPGGPWLVHFRQCPSLLAFCVRTSLLLRTTFLLGLGSALALPVEPHLSSVISAKTISKEGHTHRFQWTLIWENRVLPHNIL